MRILFGICSWGLGHATRTLPIIRSFIKEGDDVTVASSGTAQKLLRAELDGSVNFFDLADYPPPQTLNPSAYALSTFLNIPRYIWAMRCEHDFVKKQLMDRKVDVIFSDNRFGFYSLSAPSFFMTHQLRIMNPLHLKSLERGSELYNRWFLKRYTGVLVPDFKEHGLAGRLAHELSLINENRLNYIGLLSEFRYCSVPQDIDVFVTISGPEPQRSMFETLVLTQLNGIEGNVVVALGKPASRRTLKNMKIYGLMSREERNEFLNRAKLVIARSGYSTLMDLCVLGKKAFLIPTPGQTEQEYLATYHMEQGHYYSVSEQKLNIPKQIDVAHSYEPPRLQHSVERTVENAVGLITQTVKLD